MLIAAVATALSVYYFVLKDEGTKFRLEHSEIHVKRSF